MTTRILTPEEWPLLADTEAGSVLAGLEPTRTFPVVVEENGVIVACHVLMWQLHAECLWVREDRRRSLVGGKLWRAVQAVARVMGVRVLLTASCDDRVAALLEKVHGTKLPGEHYVIPIGG